MTTLHREHTAAPAYMHDAEAVPGSRTWAHGALWDGVLRATLDDNVDGPNQTIARGLDPTLLLTIHRNPPEVAMLRELPVLDVLRMNLPAPDVNDATAVASLLADPIRASIVRMLRDGPVCVCEMAAALGARENNVSNHLARLREAGLVRASRVGADTRRVYYERDDEACRRAVDALAELLR